MTQNLFVSAITFHGGINVIGYPWGSNNHVLESSWNSYVAYEAPDYVAFHRLGSAMLEAAGDAIQSLAAKQTIEKYILGDMTSTVYPVGGGMEDWGYAAGWDNKAGTDAGFEKCIPQTKPMLDNDFYESQDNIRCALYLIETDSVKDPPEATYGACQMENIRSDIFRILRSSVEDRDPENRFDGHINRNLRLITTMVDMSKPYIYVQEVTRDDEDSNKAIVRFSVNGCATLDEVSMRVNGDKKKILSSQRECFKSD